MRFEPGRVADFLGHEWAGAQRMKSFGTNLFIVVIFIISNSVLLLV